MKIEKHLISDIHESEYNPRVALDRFSKEYKAIQNSIKDYGFVEPIVVNEVTMACVGGHQRLAVMRDMGEEQIDCVMVNIENPQKEKALCIALNKIKGDWDNEKLDELLQDDKLREFELGFESIDVSLDDELGGDTNFDDNEDEDETGDDDFSLSDADDEVADAGMIIKIGNYKFDTTVSEYEKMIASIRDKGIFDKPEIIEELKRRLFND